MNQISTISEFLLHAGTDYRVFDMGRGMRKLSSQDFLDIENAITPAPAPRQQHCWFGLTFWNKQLSDQHYIWFVKLPIDEKGMLVGAARDHFLEIIVTALGEQLEHADAKQGQLPENPYTFTPTQQQLADYNSLSRKTLGLGVSSHAELAGVYLRSPTVMDWQQVPLQGLADFISTLGKADNSNALRTNFDKYALPVQKAICASLENYALGVKETEWLLGLIQSKATSLSDGDLLRALSQSQSPGLKEQAVDVCLARADMDSLVVIAGRHWETLTNESRLRNFLYAVAELDEESLFSGIYSDLVQIPNCRDIMLSALRWQEKSDAMMRAVGHLFTNQGAN